MTLPYHFPLPPRSFARRPPPKEMIENRKIIDHIDQQVGQFSTHLMQLSLAGRVASVTARVIPPSTTSSTSSSSTSSSSSSKYISLGTHGFGSTTISASDSSAATSSSNPLTHAPELPAILMAGATKNSTESSDDKCTSLKITTNATTVTLKQKASTPKSKARGRPRNSVSSKIASANRKRKAATISSMPNTPIKEMRFDFIPPLPQRPVATKARSEQETDGNNSDSSVDGNGNRIRRRRNKIPLNSLITLRKYFSEHLQFPYPSDHDKLKLAHQTGLTVQQVSHWFTNCRKRYWQPYLKGNTRKT